MVLTSDHFLFVALENPAKLLHFGGYKRQTRSTNNLCASRKYRDTFQCSGEICWVQYSSFYFHLHILSIFEYKFGQTLPDDPMHIVISQRDQEGLHVFNKWKKNRLRLPNAKFQHKVCSSLLTRFCKQWFNSLRPLRESVKLISPRLANLVPLEQPHLIPMEMHGGGLPKSSTDGSEKSLSIKCSLSWSFKLICISA